MTESRTRGIVKRRALKKMESCPRVKRQKVIDIQDVSEALDIISNLPDSVLFHILSLLPTKYVVQMSLLSRRWRDIWTCMPTLDLVENLCVSPELSDELSTEKKRFADFVSKVFQLYNLSDIQRFRLACLDCDISHVNNWIDFAIKKNVNELCLDIRQFFFKLPHSLLACRSLVSLKLNLLKCHLRLPALIYPNRLRILHINSIKFSERGSFQKLLSSCPVLETLIVERCKLWDEEVVISPPTVRNLCMKKCITSSTRIKISIPDLKSLKFIYSYRENYYLENLSSLIDAFIHIKIKSKYSSGRPKRLFYGVTKLLRGVSNARSLALSDSTVERLSFARCLLGLPPTYHNLNKLMLTVVRSKKHFQVIACLLQSSPVLESLLINMEPCPKFEYDLYKEEGQESRRLCLEGSLDHLKLMKISCFGGTEVEFEFVKLLLRKASNLESLIIIVKGEDLDKITEISMKLLLLRKASARCVISMP